MMNMQEKRSAMLSMIADWQISGKSKKAYCSENGITEATFYYWLSRSKQNDKVCGSFITIDKAPIKRNIEIIYPNGVRVNVENDLALLSQLIRLY
ncbi:IS66 family insertion sequence element accessory protein TnpA [Soonwooa purpurea]